MAAKARVRVELRVRPNATREEKEKAQKMLVLFFRNAVNKSGILTEYRRREFYESPGEKKRRKRKESERERRKQR